MEVVNISSLLNSRCNSPSMNMTLVVDGNDADVWQVVPCVGTSSDQKMDFIFTISFHQQQEGRNLNRKHELLDVNLNVNHYPIKLDCTSLGRPGNIRWKYVVKLFLSFIA